MVEAMNTKMTTFTTGIEDVRGGQHQSEVVQVGTRRTTAGENLDHQLSRQKADPRHATYSGMIATIEAIRRVVTRYGIELMPKHFGGVDLFGYAHRPELCGESASSLGGERHRGRDGRQFECWPTTK